MTSLRRYLSVFAVAIFATAIACTNALEARPIPTPDPPQPTPTPKPLVLPDDDSSHPAPIEWWYYNGHLESEDGEEYSFHFVIFQNHDSASGSYFEFGQAGITDVGAGSHVNLSSDRFGNTESSRAENYAAIVDLDLGNFRLTIDSDGTHSLEAIDAVSNASLKLQTSAPETSMLHEGIGWMKWPFGWTYYYSYPRMDATGSISLAGRDVSVSGEVWFDHQWGDFFVVGKPAGWQWFALHLDDQRSLMVSEVRGADGEVIAYDGTLVDAHGDQRILDGAKDGIELDVLEHWVSPTTGGEYPSRWRLKIDSIGIDVMMLPAIADQEVPAMLHGNQAATYWEGRVDVVDSQTGVIVGKAFAELSGYVDALPLKWRADIP